MRVIGVDLGHKNNGICCVDTLNDGLKINLFKCDKLDILNKIDKLITKDTICLIEQQRFKNKYLEGLVKGYLTAKDCDFKTVAPFTRNLGLKTSKERKSYSIDQLKKQMHISTELQKLDDIADAYNISIKYLKELKYNTKILYIDFQINDIK